MIVHSANDEDLGGDTDSIQVKRFHGIHSIVAESDGKQGNWHRPIIPSLDLNLTKEVKVDRTLRVS